MSRANEELLSKLHELMAQDMLDVIKNGRLFLDKDGQIATNSDGKPVRVAATAAQWAAIIKFLKDNGIEAVIGRNKESAIDKLAQSLPDLDDIDTINTVQ